MTAPDKKPNKAGEEIRNELYAEIEKELAGHKYGDSMERDKSDRLHRLAMMFKEAVKGTILSNTDALNGIVPDPGCVNAALADMMDRWPDFMDAHAGQEPDLEKIRGAAPYRMPPNISSDGSDFVARMVVMAMVSMMDHSESRTCEIHREAGGIENLRIKDIRALLNIREGIQTALDFFAPCQADMTPDTYTIYQGLLEVSYRMLARSNMFAEGVGMGLDFYNPVDSARAIGRVTRRVLNMKMAPHWGEKERHAVLDPLNL